MCVCWIDGWSAGLLGSGVVGGHAAASLSSRTIKRKERA
jgi:hypothetical protein